MLQKYETPAEAVKKLTSPMPPEKTEKFRPEQLLRKTDDAVAAMDVGTGTGFLRKIAEECGFELKAVASLGGDR